MPRVRIGTGTKRSSVDQAARVSVRVSRSEWRIMQSM